MLFYKVIAFTCLWLISGSSAAAGNSSANLKSVLTSPSVHWSPKTTISFPGQSNFENATERWTVFDPPTYNAVVSVGAAADVATVVHLARKYHIPFLATGGRHGFGTTLGNLQGGLAIDLSQLNTVSVNKATGLLTVGPGVVFADIYDPVYNAGYQIQTGTCACVGMIGPTLGAGIGRLTGLYGLMIDALQSVTLVTADGTTLEVSATSNADLFWGVRGAGANLGIIVSATYQLHRELNNGNYTSVDMIFPAAMNVSFFHALAAVNYVAPLALEAEIGFNATNNETTILVSGTYVGSQVEALKILAPLLDLNPPFVHISQIPWNQLAALAAFGTGQSLCANEQIINIHGLNLRNISAPTWITVFEKLSVWFDEQPLGRLAAVGIEAWSNEATVAIPDSSAAYPWRDTTAYVMIQFAWAEGDASVVSGPANTLALELRSDLVATAGYGGDLAVYVNYAHGDETLEEVYSAEKLPRLASLKKKYDPSNVFAFSNPLPTSYP